jgi:cytochrome P450
VRRISCPFHHGGDDRKSASASEAGGTVAPNIRTQNFAQARTILRSDKVHQAGFMAEQVNRMGSATRQPILFLEGEAHRVQRGATARFFTPRVVTTHYRELMIRLSDNLVKRFQRDKRAQLDQLSLELAVEVASHIIGLTNSDPAGLTKRLDVFFTGDFDRPRNKLSALAWFLRSQYRVLSFYFRDVSPAIRARKKQRQDDVISHLIDQGYNGREILTECLVYGAAGMATTREFIVMAAWHMLEREELRASFLAADESGKIALLESWATSTGGCRAAYQATRVWKARRQALQSLSMCARRIRTRTPLGNVLAKWCRGGMSAPNMAMPACPSAMASIDAQARRSPSWKPAFFWRG